ncbi:MAG: L-histidine N(alpha)-methyltransferase [Terriglobales bacterium]
MILRQAVTDDPALEFAAEVREGLLHPSQKELPSKYLYDEVGSALFEVISALPEYGLTRADQRLLRENAGEIVARVTSPVLVAELGSGSGKKTRYLLEALDTRQQTRYCPIEISHTALTMCARELGDIDHISIVGFEREYLDGLLEVADNRRPGEQLLVLFLGSTIGNFDRPADVKFLRAVRRILQPGDALLLGTDLIKPIPQMLDAYDDSLGVTAAFNLNLLARINRELGGNFALSQFRHEARFNPETRSIEMHLRSIRNQNVSIARAGLTVTFHEGETIWTESSHKYSRPELLQLAMAAGLRCEQQWEDNEWPFAETLLLAE